MNIHRQDIYLPFWFKGFNLGKLAFRVYFKYPDLAQGDILTPPEIINIKFRYIPEKEKSNG